MEKNFKCKFFHLIFEFFLILNKKNFSKCLCEKDKPILKEGECQSVYCTQDEFNNGVCKIDNDIIKTQWLNNFIDFKEYRYRFTNMVINNDGDLILETSPEETNGQRLFLRLKKNGEFFFKDNDNKKIISKKIEVLDGGNGAMRYESQVFLIKINNSEFDENKQYLVSISLYYGFMEIYDLDDNNIPFSKMSHKFHDYIIYSRKGSIIELNNKEYLYFFLGKKNNNDPSNLVIEKYSFYHNNITEENLNTYFQLNTTKEFQIKYSRIVIAYKIESDQIILFYINLSSTYKVEILNEDLVVENETYFESPQNYNDEDSIFFKSIHLKENICIFAYYTDSQKKYPKVLLINITDNQFIYMSDIYLKEYIGSNESNTDPLLNDLVKINDKRFSLISSSENRLSLYITLFDLYNNYQNIKIRFYKIDIFNLYNYKIFKDLSGIMFNNYLAVSLSTCNSYNCDNKSNDDFFTSLLIFSYVNGSNYNINISSYFSNQSNNNNDDIYLDFPNKFNIDNNIFGYQIMQRIKIISIPEEIDLYYIDNNNKTLINIGDEYDQTKKILISPKKNISKNSNIYYVEYQYQYSDPDYDTFNKYPDIISDYNKDSSTDQREEFNNNTQYYYGRTLKIEFKLCNDYCKTCKLIGKSEEQTKCEECKDNLKSYLDEESNTMTCFSEEKDCPEDYPFLNSENNNECLKNCDYEDMMSDKCILDNSSTESLQKVYIIFSNIITNEYTNEEVVLKTGDDLTFQLSNTENEKSNLNSGTRKYYNLSIIDLGECETKLKTANNIPEEESLIIFKIENYYQNTTIKNVQYEIYNPITRVKIEDLSPCKDETIDIYVPTNLDNYTITIYEEMKNQGYDIFNPNDSFYNDICTKYTSENSTDLTLNDRKNLFYNGSQIFCQENCVYQYVNVETLQAKCECSVTESTEIEYEKKAFSGIEIITSFYDTIKYSNFLILKCYELVFSSAGIKNNMGSIVLIISMCFLLIFTVIFLFTGMNKIKDQMSKMVFCSINKVNVLSISIYEPHSEDFNSLKNAIFPPGPSKKKKKKKRKIKIKIKEENPSNKVVNFNYSKTFKFSHKGSMKKKSKLKNSDTNAETIRKNTSIWGLNGSKVKGTVIQGMRKYKNSSPMVFIHKTKNGKKSIVGITQKYSEYELDDLEYLEALKYDKRTFFEFFLCLVKREHLIVFTFIFCSDLNLLVIKLSLFVFSVSLDFTTNVLFFNDDSMHKIYLDYGEYNFISQIPQIIYSTVISEILDVFLKYLSLSEKEVYECKNFKNRKEAVEEVRKLIKKIKIKFFCFFSVCIISISFFWYFITAFCAVYENTQVILFKDSAVSLLISLLYPFALYLIPAALRIMALRSTKKDKRCLYKISNIFPLF